MRLVTFNVNGLRALADSDDLNRQLDHLEADIICLQETKATKETLEARLALVPGYNSYFAFSRSRTGYSGVATFCRASWTPLSAVDGLAKILANFDIDEEEDELKDWDEEGRTIVTEHPLKDSKCRLFVVNVYCPRADADNAARQSYKLRFYSLLQRRAQALVDSGHHVIVCGDINTSHRRIDHCDPDEDTFDLNPSRILLNRLLIEPSALQCQVVSDISASVREEDDKEDDKGEDEDSTVQGLLFDAFRLFYPSRENAFTCWNTKLNCRASNFGTRIDYILPSKSLADCVTACEILPDVQGSDHCPVQADFNLTSEEGHRDPPSSCTAHWPQFGGKHRKLSSFFVSKKELTATTFAKNVSSPKLERANSHGSKTNYNKRIGEKKSTAKVKQRKLGEFFISGKQTVVVSGNRVKEENLSDEFSRNICDLNAESKLQYQISSQSSNSSQSSSSDVSVVNQWRSLLSGKPPSAPNCKGHNEPCVLRTVKKKGLNMGRQFWCCARGEGKIGDADARCNFFQWLKS